MAKTKLGPVCMKDYTVRVYLSMRYRPCTLVNPYDAKHTALHRSEAKAQRVQVLLKDACYM